VISISTNVCGSDSVRIRHTLPSWLRIFPEASEFVVVVDESPPAGRIARLHRGHSDLSALYAELQTIQKRDARVRIERLPQDAEPTLARWFGPASWLRYPLGSAPRPIRCQAGTPIFAFAHAVEVAHGPTVLRTDCDMLFFNDGWLRLADQLLTSGADDLLEPHRLGGCSEPYEFSTRAFVLNKSQFHRRLPIVPRVLDLMRFAHRIANQRPPWLALEQMLDAERQAGKIKARSLPAELGFSLHVATHDDASLPWFHSVPPLVETDAVPDGQRRFGQNFHADAWKTLLAKAG
jgi:hypothetical protein